MASREPNNIQELLSQYNLETDSCGTDGYLRCTICRKLMIDAYQAHCGCQYCFVCISNHLSVENNYCVGGKPHCSGKPLILGSNVTRNPYLDTLISQVIVICPNESCDYRTKLDEMGDHMRLCEKKSIECPYNIIGCDNIMAAKNIILEHLNNESIPHARLLIEIIYNLKNDFDGLKNSFDILKKNCENSQLEVTYLKEDSAYKETKIAALETEANENQNKILKLETDVNGYQVKINKLETEEKEGQDRMIKLETEVEEYQNKMIKLETKVDEFKNKIVKLETEAKENQVAKEDFKEVIQPIKPIIGATLAKKFVLKKVEEKGIGAVGDICAASSRDKGDEIRVIVKSVSLNKGRFNVTIRCWQSTTVKEFKVLIGQRTNWDDKYSKLSFEGGVLDDDKRTLLDYDIEDGSVVMMVSLIRGS